MAEVEGSRVAALAKAPERGARDCKLVLIEGNDLDAGTVQKQVEVAFRGSAETRFENSAEQSR